MKIISLAELKQKTGIGFGTSGIRGLVSQLTDEVCYAYTVAFLKFLEERGELKNNKVAIAGDRRESTTRIMSVVHSAIKDAGRETINCGLIPSPALAYYGINKNIPSIMITGSHIPDDRNGIKFFKSEGEILKSDEAIISNLTVNFEDNISISPLPAVNEDARKMYVTRYLNFFPKSFLLGKRIGIYGQSAVGREIMEEILSFFGAEITKIEYSDVFEPIDTEIFSDDLIKKGKKWSLENQLWAIISTDGDSDRPLMADEKGDWIRGDVLDILTAKILGAEMVVTPVSSNTVVEKCGFFNNVLRTKIGSPYVVEEMINSNIKGNNNIVGYEANGGFFIYSPLKLGSNIISPLPTRDAIVVLLSVLFGCKDEPLSEMVNKLPKRHTQSNSVKEFPTELGLKIVSELSNGDIEGQLEGLFGKVFSVNRVDGLRITFENGEIVHFRPSQNAPEFRNYTEANSKERADELCQKAGQIILKWKNGKY